MPDLTRTPITPQDLYGPELHYMGITKKMAVDSFNKHGITLEQGRALYAYYNAGAQKAYAALTDPIKQLRPRGQEAPVTDTSAAAARKILENLKFDHEGFNKICAEVGLDDEITGELFSDYESQTIAAAESVVEAAEQAEEVANQEAENQLEEAQQSPTFLTVAEAQAYLDKINNDPTHPFLNEKATPAEHARAVDLTIRLREIIAGHKTDLSGVYDATDKEYAPKVEDRSSSSGGNTNKSYDEPDFKDNDITRGGQSSSNSEEGQFAEGED